MLTERLLSLVESVRQLGHAALRDGDDPHDALDRQLDAIVGFVTPGPEVPPGCEYDVFSSRVCERGTGGCTVIHDPGPEADKRLNHAREDTTDGV